MLGAWKARSWAPEGDTGRGAAQVCRREGKSGAGKSRGPGGDSVWGSGGRERAVKATERRGAREPRSWARCGEPGVREAAPARGVEGRSRRRRGGCGGGPAAAAQTRVPGRASPRRLRRPFQGRASAREAAAPAPACATAARTCAGRAPAGRGVARGRPDGEAPKGQRTRGAPAGAALACAGEAPAGPAARRLRGPLRAAL